MALLFVILEGNRTRKCNPFVVFLNLSFLVQPSLLDYLTFVLPGNSNNRCKLLFAGVQLFSDLGSNISNMACFHKIISFCVLQLCELLLLTSYKFLNPSLTRLEGFRTHVQMKDGQVLLSNDKHKRCLLPLIKCQNEEAQSLSSKISNS